MYYNKQVVKNEARETRTVQVAAAGRAVPVTPSLGAAGVRERETGASPRVTGDKIRRGALRDRPDGNTARDTTKITVDIPITITDSIHKTGVTLRSVINFFFF